MRVMEAFGAAKAAGLPKKENSAVGMEVKLPPKAMDLAFLGVRAGYTWAEMADAASKDIRTMLSVRFIQTS